MALLWLRRPRLSECRLLSGLRLSGAACGYADALAWQKPLLVKLLFLKEELSDSCPCRSASETSIAVATRLADTLAAHGAAEALDMDAVLQVGHCCSCCVHRRPVWIQLVHEGGSSYLVCPAACVWDPSPYCRGQRPAMICYLIKRRNIGCPRQTCPLVLVGAASIEGALGTLQILAGMPLHI